jgi:hypothetical protein
VSYDLLLKGARVVDPGNGVDAIADLAIEGGKVARIDADISPRLAKRTWNLHGRTIAPGLIDNHMHSTLGPGGEATYAMLARAGVTTATDFAGSPSQVMSLVAKHGSGITIASLQVLRPKADDGEHAFSSGPETLFDGRNPSAEQIRAGVEKGLKEGAIGSKILGGHFPFTPEATLTIIEETIARGVYMALHVGTTETGSNLAGLTEAVGFAAPNRRIHLCHISSALRGQILPSRLDETAKAMDLLEQAGNSVVSESFLTRWSPDPGKCVDGVPDSLIVQTSLKAGGYEPTEAGLEKAIREGYTIVNIPQGDNNVAVTGEEGLAYWREMETAAGIAFPISYADTGLICATQKRKDGRFTVTALASDAGLLPFNVTLNHGLMLVEFGAFTLNDLIFKASYAPARMLGLTNKGRLNEGADADIVVIDLEKKAASHLLVAGELVMTDGLIIGRGGTFLTTEAGIGAVQAHGLPHQVLDLSESLLYRDW